MNEIMKTLARDSNNPEAITRATELLGELLGKPAWKGSEGTIITLIARLTGALALAELANALPKLTAL